MNTDKNAIAAKELLVSAAKAISEKNFPQGITNALLVLSEHVDKAEGAGPILQGLFKANGSSSTRDLTDLADKQNIEDKLQYHIKAHDAAQQAGDATGIRFHYERLQELQAMRKKIL